MFKKTTLSMLFAALILYLFGQNACWRVINQAAIVELGTSNFLQNNQQLTHSDDKENWKNLFPDAFEYIVFALDIYNNLKMHLIQKI